MVSSPVEVTPLPIGLPLPPDRAQRYLRSADPAAQGFLKTLRNVGTGRVASYPGCPGQCRLLQGAARHCRGQPGTAVLAGTPPTPTRGGVVGVRTRRHAFPGPTTEMLVTAPTLVPRGLLQLLLCASPTGQALSHRKWQDGGSLCHLWILPAPG